MNKYILLIDTSKPGIDITVAKRDGSNIVSENILTDENNKQSVELPSAVEKFLNKNNLKFDDISAVATVVGPGSFTGIRLAIAYAKGLSIGLNIPIVPINKFEIYLNKHPDAFVALDSGKNDLFVAAHDLEPQTMDIETVETKQMEYPKTVGHIPYNLSDVVPIVINKIKLNKPEPVIPMYLRPSYAELNCKC